MFVSKKEYAYSTRLEFEHKFNIIAELLQEGKLRFSIEATSSIESLRKIRKLSNGRLDLNTINEIARSTAHFAGNVELMKDINNYEKK